MIYEFGIIVVSQYILKQENVKQSFDISSVQNKDIENDEYYEEVSMECGILTNDIDVIDMIYKKVCQVQYNEENNIDCAEAVYSIAAFLATDMIKNQTKWGKVKGKVLDILNQMNIKDFITTIQIAGIEDLCEMPEFLELIKQKIPQMTEYEFLRIYSSLIEYDFEFDDEFEEIITEKVEKSSKVLAPKYILMSDNASDVLELLDKVENPEKIEAIVEALNFWDEDIDLKIQEIIEGLSDEQIVRFMFAIRCFDYGNNEIDDLLIRKMELLKKEDLELVVLAYLDSPREEIKSKIIELAIRKKLINRDESNGALELKKQGFEDEDFEKRFTTYRKFEGPIGNLAVMQCEDDLSDALILYSSMDNTTEEAVLELEEEVSERILYKYEQFNQAVDITEEMLEYVNNLSKMDDRSIIKIIKCLGQQLGDLETDDIEEEEPLNFIRANSCNLVKNYLYNRILEMKDKGAILLLSTIYNTTNCASLDEIIAVKLSQCMEQMKFAIPDNEER